MRATGNGTIQIGAANGATFDPITSDIPGAVTVSASGWYTLQQVYHNVGGVLSVDMNLVAADGTVVHVATLSNPADTIGGVGGVVGGNRYGWFTDISVTGGLAVDAFQLGSLAGAVTEVAEGPNEAAALYTASGVLPFSDVDVTDTHTVTVTPVGTNYRGALTATIADSTGDGFGSVTWSFNADNGQVDSLAAGQVATQVYTLTVDDGHGGTSSQNVTITHYRYERRSGSWLLSGFCG